MEEFLFVFLASFVDMIRWIICYLSTRFVRNYLGALLVGVGVTSGVSVYLGTSAVSLFAGGLATATIISAMYVLRQSRRSKAQAST